MATQSILHGEVLHGEVLTAKRRAQSEAQVDPRLVRLTQLFDEAWEIPGTNYRVGIDALVGLIPGVGDLVTALIGRWMMAEAKRLGVPKWRRAQILSYYVVDMIGGAVPLVGDVFDAAYKANKKSLAVIEKHLKKRRTQNAKRKTI